MMDNLGTCDEKLCGLMVKEEGVRCVVRGGCKVGWGIGMVMRGSMGRDEASVNGSELWSGAADK